MHQFIAAFGYFVMILLAWLMSSHKRVFPWRAMLGGTLACCMTACIAGILIE